VISHKSLRALVFLALLASACLAHAGLVVIVNPQSGVDRLSKSQVINIFLANSREYPNGLPTQPIDLASDLLENEQFYRGLINRNPIQMKAYWSRLVFSGQASPPVKANNWQEVLRMVATNRNAIGYVEAEHADPAQVKVVFILP
jgi:ABC-type phosphate transport system substrate-binding protein